MLTKQAITVIMNKVHYITDSYDNAPQLNINLHFPEKQEHQTG
jgi:hypothetical protein